MTSRQIFDYLKVEGYNILGTKEDVKVLGEDRFLVKFDGQCLKNGKLVCKSPSTYAVIKKQDGHFKMQLMPSSNDVSLNGLDVEQDEEAQGEQQIGF